jgi:large subunit ribosomal protein L4
MRREALRAALAAKIAAGELVAIEALEGMDGKTKSLVARLAALGPTGVPTLLVTASLDEPLRRAARNIPWVVVEPPSHVSVYQLLRARRVVAERAALLALEEALAP